MNRKERKISQEDLSYGICSTSNLSRIENNEQIPSRVKYESLMERMGLSPLIFPSFRSEREVEIYRLRHEINQLFKPENYKKVEKLLSELKLFTIKEQSDKIFIEYVDTLLLIWKNESAENVLKAMKTVAEKSVMDLNPNKIINQSLSLLDLCILRNLALAYYDAEQKETGIDLLYSLVHYIEVKVVDYKGISPLYTGILHCLTNWVGLQGDHTEVIRLCDIGIKRCKEYSAYSFFAELKFNKGYALIMLGDKNAAREYIQDAFFINRAKDETEICEVIKDFASEQRINLGN